MSETLRIGILGGGQLGRMLGLAGIPLGIRFRFLDPAGAVAPAAAVGEVLEGDHDDPEVLERFAAGLDVVSWEFENIPVAVARALAERLPVFPPPDALEVTQDRWSEKEIFRRLGIPAAPSLPVTSREELKAAVSELGLPALLKTRRLGYDGKGQFPIRHAADVDPAFDALGGRPLILERFIGFRRELSVLSVRGRDGEIRSWPVVENEHRAGILRTSRVPAPGSSFIEGGVGAEAEAYMRSLLEALDYVGVIAVEFFETEAGLVANEIAPRVHNSGHWTQDGAGTSQFENHLRAVLGLPLGPTGLRFAGDGGGGAAMVNFIGGVPPREALLAAEVVGGDGSGVLQTLHLYDKARRPGRKVGHLNLWGRRGEEMDLAVARASELAERYGEG